ncbi:ABC transporter substrate-binding protein [Thermopolyspora sp. NPDC052614]|uniref:ABC transporter substrate-binding protein n=1 Tax=Thermopolyspora sp. NPDC052614 TaxID=3155682 RepID=UPI003448B8E3
MKLSLMGRLFLAGAVVALAAGACGGGSDGAQPSSSGGKPEKTNLVVGAVPVPDVAPLQIAIRRGFFKEEGLTVKMEPIRSSIQALPALTAGTMDVTLFNYTVAFDQEEKQPGSFKIIADAFQAASNTFVLVVPADSPITKPAELKGKTIATPGITSIGTLLIEATLKTYGVNAKQDGIKYVEMPLPNVPQALKTKQIDAALLAEPFISAVQKDQGARKIADLITGPTADFPIAGWGASAEWVKKYPNTLAAFQRAIGKAQQLASSDRKVVEEVLPAYTQITKEVASVITLGTFPTSISDIRLQRVADVMYDNGWLKNKGNAKAIIVGQTGT